MRGSAWVAVVLVGSVMACAPGTTGGGEEPTRSASNQSSSSGAPGCGEGRVLCGSVCTDTQGDGSHCGTCENACSDEEICQSGACVEAPDCREQACTGLTYCDLGSGRCRSGCIQSEQCGPQEVCNVSNHACECASAHHRCGGACVTNASVATCGTRCEACETPSNASPMCVSGNCDFTCNQGFRECSGTCAACPAGAASTTCNGTACVANSCNNGGLATDNASRVPMIRV